MFTPCLSWWLNLTMATNAYKVTGLENRETSSLSDVPNGSLVFLKLAQNIKLMWKSAYMTRDGHRPAHKPKSGTNLVRFRTWESMFGRGAFPKHLPGFWPNSGVVRFKRPGDNWAVAILVPPFSLWTVAWRKGELNLLDWFDLCATCIGLCSSWATLSWTTLFRFMPKDTWQHHF